MTLPRFNPRPDTIHRAEQAEALQPPTAAFSFQVSGLTVAFTDLSVDPDGQIVSRVWDFGDSATMPTAAFAASPNGLTVTFTDQSFDVPPGTIVAWFWQFGDGTTSATQHPVKVYAGPGAFSISLRVTDNDGNQSVAAQQVITVSATGAKLVVFSFMTGPTTTETIGVESIDGHIGASPANSIIQRINFCRENGLVLMPNLAGGDDSKYATNGNFDIEKWKSVFALSNTPAIKAAIAGAVADGTIPGCSLIDEPLNQRWGTTFQTDTKAKLDVMAAFAHSIHPTLPVGPTIQWFHLEERPGTLQEVDFIISQWTANKFPGTLAGYRTGGDAQATAEGCRIVYSINILNYVSAGSDGVCGTDTGGNGTRPGICRITAAQLQNDAIYLGASSRGVITLWKYDSNFFGRSDNRTALAAVAAYLDTQPRLSLKRA